MCNFKRVLFIAPSDNRLNPSAEIDSLCELGYTVQPAQGIVTRERLFELIRHKDKEFDIVHFACDCTKDGAILSNGQLFDAAAIVQLCKSCKAVLVFLNGCETVEIGQLLVDYDVPAAICTLRTVTDDMAKETAQVFYKSLIRHKDIRAAYNESRPPIKGGYSLFTDGALEDIQFGPVLARLSAIDEMIKTNNTEHSEFRISISDLVVGCANVGEQRRWFLITSCAVVVVATIVQTIIMLVGRVP